MKKTSNRRGAPKKDNPAIARFEVRCTPDEKASWEIASKKADQSLSAWIKSLANRNA